MSAPRPSLHRAERIGLDYGARPNIRLVRCADGYPVDYRGQAERRIKFAWAFGLIVAAVIGLAALAVSL